jgi:hypothetical protein
MRSPSAVLAKGRADRGPNRPSRSRAALPITEAGAVDAGSWIDSKVGAELVSQIRADAALVQLHPDEWASVHVLALASVLLPRLARPFALLSADVPASLYEAAIALLDREDRAEADRLADAARRMLAGHLVDSRRAVTSQPSGRWTLRAWLVTVELPAVVAELQAAAWSNRLRLLAAEFGADVLARLFMGHGWPSHPLRQRPPARHRRCLTERQPS